MSNTCLLLLLIIQKKATLSKQSSLTLCHIKSDIENGGKEYIDNKNIVQKIQIIKYVQNDVLYLKNRIKTILRTQQAYIQIIYKTRKSNIHSFVNGKLYLKHLLICHRSVIDGFNSGNEILVST